MQRKQVRPAAEGGRIFNPVHLSFLPPGGAEVEWTPYWISLEQRGDIIAADPEPDAPVSGNPPATSPGT